MVDSIDQKAPSRNSVFGEVFEKNQLRGAGGVLEVARMAIRSIMPVSEILVGRCPERQRGRTVNPLAQPSKVRVLPGPPCTM